MKKEIDLMLSFNARLLHTSEIRFKVSLAMAPAQRPRGILGFWSTLITSLGNTDEMPVSTPQSSFQLFRGKYCVNAVGA